MFTAYLCLVQVVEKLGLSYHNIRALHQKIDKMPEKAGEWQTKVLRFDDCPDETFTVRHRDPVEAIKGPGSVATDDLSTSKDLQ